MPLLKDWHRRDVRLIDERLAHSFEHPEMKSRNVSVWYDAEGDYLEVLFDQRAGYFRATEDDRVMEKVDLQGTVLGFAMAGLNTFKGETPVRIALPGGALP